MLLLFRDRGGVSGLAPESYRSPLCVCCFLLLVLTALFIPPAFSDPIFPVEYPAEASPKEVELGRQLFNSVLLSADNSVSCASCHDLSQGGEDGRAFSIGINGQVGEINTPSVLNAALNPYQFWDGRAVTLEEQVAGPVHHPKEMGSNWEQVVAKLTGDVNLSAQFSAVYGERPNAGNIARAIAVYEQQLVTVDAPFDRFLKGQQNAISAQAKTGYRLFRQIGCVSCHQGRNVGGNMFQYFGIMGDYLGERGNLTKADYGRYNVTGRDEDLFKFRVPSLRNVEHTAPYFHDGSAETLEQAVRVMSHYQLGLPIKDDEVEAITAFLRSLSGELVEGVR